VAESATTIPAATKTETEAARDTSVINPKASDTAPKPKAEAKVATTTKSPSKPKNQDAKEKAAKDSAPPKQPDHTPDAGMAAAEAALINPDLDKETVKELKTNPTRLLARAVMAAKAVNTHNPEELVVRFSSEIRTLLCDAADDDKLEPAQKMILGKIDIPDEVPTAEEGDDVIYAVRIDRDTADRLTNWALLNGL
jgi:hypothetical protein